MIAIAIQAATLYAFREMVKQGVVEGMREANNAKKDES